MTSTTALPALAKAQKAYEKAHATGVREDHEMYEALVQEYAWAAGVPLDRAYITVEEGPVVRVDAPTATRQTSASGDDISRHIVAPVSIDVFENGAGQIDVAGQEYDMYRESDNWHAVNFGDSSDHVIARTVPDLARKLANKYGVSGTISIEDERGGKRSLSQRFEHTPAAQRPAKVKSRRAAEPAHPTRRADDWSAFKEQANGKFEQIMDIRAAEGAADDAMADRYPGIPSIEWTAQQWDEWAWLAFDAYTDVVDLRRR